MTPLLGSCRELLVFVTSGQKEQGCNAALSPARQAPCNDVVSIICTCRLQPLQYNRATVRLTRHNCPELIIQPREYLMGTSVA